MADMTELLAMTGHLTRRLCPFAYKMAGAKTEEMGKVGPKAAMSRQC